MVQVLKGKKRGLAARKIVKARLLKVDPFKARAVVNRLNTVKVQNPKHYAISMLYNA